MECPEAAEKIIPGDDIEVDFETGVIKNISKNEIYQSEPMPEFIRALIAENGLVNYTRDKLGKE